MRKTKISQGTIHPLPEDIRDVLLANPQALARWEDLTPLARNEWICWVTIVKKEETRKKHIERMIEELLEGGRRPCCWPGCPHHRPSAQKWFQSRKPASYMPRLKRIYEKPGKDDGYRILVDRLWPRGMSKEKAALDLWLKDIAPSTELRKWFGHDLKRWPAFQKKYQAEIKANKDIFSELKKLIKHNKNVTLLYAAKDEEHNEAVVIKEVL